MTNEYLNLRNTVHRDEFRLNLTPTLWKTQYNLDKELDANNVIVIRKNKTLRGYAICSLVTRKQIKEYHVQEICSDGKDTLIELLDQIIERGVKKEVDFITLRRCDERFSNLFDEKGFLTTIQMAIVVRLLNPRELLLSISKKIEGGKILRLVVKGFDPTFAKVRKGEIMVVEDKKADLTVLTDRNTFLKLLFGKTSFWKEFLKRNVVISGIQHLLIAFNFFKTIKNDKWYIPPRDGC